MTDQASTRDGDSVSPVLEVRGLRTSFTTRAGVIRAVTGIDFSVSRNEVLGLVGESGCGKSVTSLSILGLVGEPGKVEAGEVMFDGKDLLTLPDEELRKIRGDRIAMIFQQPQSSLNPVMKVGDQISEALLIHSDLNQKAAHARTLELMDMVGIPDPKTRYGAYPHEMSGGMAQRVMIAIALSCEPELLIADEPTTALDVTIQAQILDLMRMLQEQTGTAIILITHDLGVVAEMCDRAAVMYAGEIVEQTDVKTLFTDPKHPYTLGLIGAVPVPGESPRGAGHHPRFGAQPHRATRRLSLRASLPGARGARQRARRARPSRAAARRRESPRSLLALPPRGRAARALTRTPGRRRAGDRARRC